MFGGPHRTATLDNPISVSAEADVPASLQCACPAGIDRLVTLGAPHNPPPQGVLDQTRGILTYVQQSCPGNFHQEVRLSGASPETRSCHDPPKVLNVMPQIHLYTLRRCSAHEPGRVLPCVTHWQTACVGLGMWRA